MRTLVCGFSIGALLLACPWPWRPWLVLQWLSVVATLFAVWRGIGRFEALRTRGFDGARLRAGDSASRRSAANASIAVLGLLLGCAWSVFTQERELAHRVEPGGTRDAVPLVIRIVSDPVPLVGTDPGELALRFQADTLGDDGAANARPRRLRLSWYGAEPVQRGEIWRVATTVRPPLGYVNPGGFDYERWLFGQGIHGTGAIRRGTRIAPADPGRIERIRERLGAFLSAQDLTYGPVLAALLIGVSGGIPAEQWAVFRVTGTIHLMVISGLHIGLAASLGYAAGRWFVRLCPFLLLWLDARKAGAWCGVCCAAGYLALSGGGLPAVRACVMAAPALLLVAWGRRCQAGTTLLVALGGVLALEPLAVHQQGFWLSFGAVALLVLRFAGRYGREAAPVALVKTQVLLTVCMAPLLILLMGAVPLVGAAANLVAVPVVSLAVVPLALGGGLLANLWPMGASACFALADWLLGPVFAFLTWCSGVPLLQTEPPAGAAIAALLAGLVWLFGVPPRQQALLALCLAAALLPRPTGVVASEFRVLGLDVGQGDAILVDTARHRLLFDAGPAYPGGFEVGSAVVVPSTLATGPGRIDALVLSHEDLDHVGGAPAVELGLSVVATYASFRRPGSAGCATAAWTWDGVSFRFLDVPRSGPGGRPLGSNDGSCILLIENGRRRVLLAGDIGAPVEARLLRRLAGPVDLLFAPHHGSRSSSSRAFVRVARPRWVFVSAGRDNRYGHPHPQVVERYRAIGAGLLLTAELGALVWESRGPGDVRGWRQGWVPYWRGAARGLAGG